MQGIRALSYRRAVTDEAPRPASRERPLRVVDLVRWANHAVERYGLLWVEGEAGGRKQQPVLRRQRVGVDLQVGALLDRRRRQTFVILAAIYALFLIRQLALYFSGSGGSEVQAVLLSVAFTVQTGLALVATLARQKFARFMSAAEWVSLGTLWATQSLNQFVSLCKQDEVIRLLGSDEVGQVLTANTWLLPWFAVMAGYPVLVPHTVRRTVWIVGVTALLPVVVVGTVDRIEADMVMRPNNVPGVVVIRSASVVPSASPESR